MLSIYVHIPFCIKRCDYCDFITFTARDELLPYYSKGIAEEIFSIGNSNALRIEKVDTVYFGGGTPSLLAPEMVSSCLGTISAAFDLDPFAEITMEANPGSIKGEYLKTLRSFGVNRLSFGVQSFLDDELSLLGRIHTVKEVYNTFSTARSVGFDNISIDLIFGLPYQTLDNWKFCLKEAVRLRPEHLSLYSLTIEPGTALGNRVVSGDLVEPDPDENADMFEYAMEFLKSTGYHHYEISNWAINQSKEARHNKVYWENKPYLGIGTAAHGYLNGYRLENVKDIKGYIERINSASKWPDFPFSPANISALRIDKKMAMQESLLLGLRKVHEGVSCAEFSKVFQENLRKVFREEISRLQKKGLVEWVSFLDGEHLRLTHLGIMLGNQVFIEFV